MKCAVCDYNSEDSNKRPIVLPIHEDTDLWRRFIVACPECLILSLGNSEDL